MLPLYPPAAEDAPDSPAAPVARGPTRGATARAKRVRLRIRDAELPRHHRHLRQPVRARGAAGAREPGRGRQVTPRERPVLSTPGPSAGAAPHAPRPVPDTAAAPEPPATPPESRRRRHVRDAQAPVLPPVALYGSCGRAEGSQGERRGKWADTKGERRGDRCRAGCRGTETSRNGNRGGDGRGGETEGETGYGTSSGRPSGTPPTRGPSRRPRSCGPRGSASGRPGRGTGGRRTSSADGTTATGRTTSSGARRVRPSRDSRCDRGQRHREDLNPPHV